MKISWNWLSELVDISNVGTPEKLADILTARGLEVEEILRQDQGFEKVITAEILVRDKHPQADRLSLCQMSTGGEPFEVVCGAQNMKAGDRVALAQIGARLPNGMTIERSKIRGVVSNGMLCSEAELGLLKSGQESEGILILPSGTPIGRPLAELLGRNDTILTLKLTANRGDCLSHFGVAREVASALGLEPKPPAFPVVVFDGKSSISIHLEAGEEAPQFYGVSIEGVKVGPSPEWLTRRLEALGSRSINNVVDATNYVMLELGHPLHAYDTDSIDGGEIRVRGAREGECLPLLDGSEIKTKGGELVIGDRTRAIGLAGIMGGGNSEVRDATTKLFLECAEFNAVRVRQASTMHQKKTDAAHRFERGIDPAGLERAISRLAGLILELAGGMIRGASMAQLPLRKAGAEGLRRRIRLSQDFSERLLGLQIDVSRVEKILQDLDCEVRREEQDWVVTAPSYRHDLRIPEDLAEEVARTVGYDAIPSTIPALTGEPTFAGSTREQNELVDRAKDSLVRQGFCEALNFAFTSRGWLTRFNLESSAKVLNPLSEEHEALVPSLLPGLVSNAIENRQRHFGSEPLSIRLFELRPTFSSSGAIRAEGDGETGVRENWKLALVMSGQRYASGLRDQNAEVDFYDLKSVVENVLGDLGTRGVRVLPLGAASAASSSGSSLGHLFHPGQTAEVRVGKDLVGWMGLMHPAISKDLKVRDPLWMLEIDWQPVSQLSISSSENRPFRPWAEFPPMERDFALVVKSEILGDKITQVALQAGKPLAKVAKIFDIYRGSQVAQGMTSVAVRVIFYEEGRSLQDAEAEAASKKILEAWKKELGADLRS